MIRRFLILGLVVLASCFGPSSSEKLGGEILKVAILGPVGDIDISCEGAFMVEDESTGRTPKSLKSLHVRAKAGKLESTLAQTTPGPLRLTPRNSAHEFSVAGRSYVGEIRVVPRGDELLVILEVPLEDYVAGVVSAESGKLFKPEALKAQAVVSRTYALFKRQYEPREPALFDVWADTRDQVFKGSVGVSSNHRKAARETKGLYLAYRRRPLPSYFHSTCGGRTQDAVAASFLKEPMTPLGGVECRGCRHSPHWQWSVSVPLQELSLEFQAETGGEVSSVSLTEAVEGRHAAVILQGRRKALIPAHIFRRRLGTSKVKSTSFEFKNTPGTLSIEGHGWGHGVGLCQWGSDGLAREGRDFREILAHYFPGAQLIRIS